MSASCAPPQAVATMARSSRRCGAKMPGVSTKMICAAPSIAMPRTSARVVCTLCVTIETLAPTSALTSVDLPALGAPISATKPQRVASACGAGSAIERVRGLDAFARQHGGGGGLLGRALGAAEAFRRRELGQLARRRGIPDRGPGRSARPRDRPASAGRAPAPIPAAPSWDRAAAAAGVRMRSCHSRSISACGRRIAAVEIHRADQRLADVGQDRRAACAPPALASEAPSRMRGAEIDRARDRRRRSPCARDRPAGATARPRRPSGKRETACRTSTRPSTWSPRNSSRW